MKSVKVHLPVRLLHRDLKKHGFPVLRYQIQWTPPQTRPYSMFKSIEKKKNPIPHDSIDYVTHGTDRSIWAFLTDVLTPDQVDIARSWLGAVNKEISRIETLVRVDL